MTFKTNQIRTGIVPFECASHFIPPTLRTRSTQFLMGRFIPATSGMLHLAPQLLLASIESFYLA